MTPDHEHLEGDEQLSVGETWAAREIEQDLTDLHDKAAAQVGYDDLERSGFLRPRPCGCTTLIAPGGDYAHAVLKHTCGLPDEHADTT